MNISLVHKYTFCQYPHARIFISDNNTWNKWHFPKLIKINYVFWFKGNGKKYNETGVHNMIYYAETGRETILDQRPKHLNSLIKDISQIKSSNMQDEYKVCWNIKHPG